MDDTRERARSLLAETMRYDWKAAMDDSLAPEMRELNLRLLNLLKAGDLDGLETATSADLVIRQPPQLPGARTYHGIDGLIEAFVDWPSQWEETHIEPVRTWQAGPDVVITRTHQTIRGSESGLELEADFWFVFRWRGDLLASWTMYVTEEEAEQAASD